MRKYMAKTSVLDYIPQKPKDVKKLVQVMVPADLHQDIRKYIDDNDLDWTKIVVACLCNFKDTVIKKK